MCWVFFLEFPSGIHPWISLKFVSWDLCEFLMGNLSSFFWNFSRHSIESIFREFLVHWRIHPRIALSVSHTILNMIFQSFSSELLQENFSKNFLGNVFRKLLQDSFGNFAGNFMGNLFKNFWTKNPKIFENLIQGFNWGFT